MLVQPALSFALSLGDIDLRSHLGEPLKAIISINDAETALEANCFTVADTGEVQAFRKASTTLNQTSGTLSLVVTTNQVIAEPIVNLTVAYHCEPNVNREYVLLLDPAPLTVANPEITANTSQTTTGNKQSSNSISAKKSLPIINESSPDTTVTTAETPVKKARPKKKKARKPIASSIDDKLNEAYTGKPQTEPAPETKARESSTTETVTPASAAKPMLVISGGSANATETGTGLSLRMETQLDLNRVETNTVPLTAVETMDEVTVMSNRLAHLEKQILSLQSKNQQLQAEAEKAKNAGFTLSPEVWQWLKYILIGLAIILALVGTEVLRRKLLRDRWARDEAVWFDPATDELDDPELPASENLPNLEPRLLQDPLFNEGATSNANLIASSEDDEADSVLEHAEVFIAHGRPILAIQLLQNHLVDSPTQSPTIWLKLMSLLAKESSEQEYDAAVIECNQFFNIKMPSFAEFNEVDHSSIEDHPHIVDRLEGAWGSPFAITLLNDLIYNQQSQPREGFARGTFEELFFLKKISETLQSTDTLKQSANLSGIRNAYQSNTSNSGNPGTAKTAAVSMATLGNIVSDAANEDKRLNEVSSPALQNHDQISTNPESAIQDDVKAVTQPELIPAMQKSLQSDSAYEVSMIVDDDTSAFEMPDHINSIEPSSSDDMALAFTVEDEADDFKTLRAEDFQMAEIDFPVSEEVDIELTSENIAPENLNETDFNEAFADALEFDQEDLLATPNPAEDDEAKTKKSNVIEFDWDLPKIDKE